MLDGLGSETAGFRRACAALPMADGDQFQACGLCEPRRAHENDIGIELRGRGQGACGDLGTDAPRVPQRDRDPRPSHQQFVLRAPALADEPLETRLDVSDLPQVIDDSFHHLFSLDLPAVVLAHIIERPLAGRT